MTNNTRQMNDSSVLAAYDKASVIVVLITRATTIVCRFGTYLTKNKVYCER